MCEQRTIPHLEWELHQAELELARRQVRIDILLNRCAHLQIEARQRESVTPPEGKA